MNKTIEKYKIGTQYVNITSSVSDDDLSDCSSFTDNYLNKSCVKFIPASGAATRMFKDLYTYLDDLKDTSYIKTFFNELTSFAFYQDLNLSNKDDNISIVRALLEDKLKYGHLPKALIKMHQYGDVCTTPIDEHIVEGEAYLNNNHVRLHFTISEDHEVLFNDYVNKVIKDKPHVSITYSFQKKHTDTLAVDVDNNPFKTEAGEPLYRPGGHGSLIENLNDLDADIIFIKNIDNVCHQDYLDETVSAKKKLASIGLKTKEAIDAYLLSLLEGTYDLDAINTFLKETLNITLKTPLTKAQALAFLNRPLRVCGVVKNTGEPGGGPFIVDNGDYYDPQIVETSEIDRQDALSVKLLNESKYFNPVDLVCFVKDYKGDKFNLLNYVNEDRYFITEKSYKGTPLKALEHPGLWNGAMHHWNTLFVEVPLITFNPVKTVNDLLRQGHRPKKN